jgi:hypothetical protein
MHTDKGYKREKLSRFIPFVLSRAHIMASGNCLGLVALLLKFFKKVRQPRRQRSLNGVVLTKALADYPLNIAR